MVIKYKIPFRYIFNGIKFHLLMVTITGLNIYTMPLFLSNLPGMPIAITP